MCEDVPMCVFVHLCVCAPMLVCAPMCEDAWNTGVLRPYVV